ncbi:glutaredoxin family protein [Shewanella algae]|uniref:glutaredoxin family protein n=1 Tax=Shewanella algae TaxID=38313 RepID=UPI0030067C9E
MFVIRWILGRIILLLNFVFSPKGLKRQPEQQADIDEQCRSLSLYQYPACPFCVKVRRAMKRQSLNITTLDAKQEPHKSALQNGGGPMKVPCLKIEQDGEVTWMYESNDIISYLNQRFG